jgi:hypothetical protein
LGGCGGGRCRGGCGLLVVLDGDLVDLGVPGVLIERRDLV